ncbi:MAG: hypothetical protein GXX96_05595 [Planctomycetaceae bacterium]|nr:hypothetical protein [Planctomycetaceae bacterium]
MSEPPAESHVAAGEPPRASFHAAHLALWLPLCLIHGAAAAWLAYGVQKHFAPLGLFPILVGLAIGVTLAGLTRLVHVAGRGTILAGAVLSCAVAVFGQHYFSYQEQKETAQRQAAQFQIAARAHPDLVRGTPPKPASGVLEYLRWQAIRGRPIAGRIVARDLWAWASWALDGCLTLAATLLVIVPAARQPYCDRCRTWFSTVRRGRLPAATAADLAAAVGLEPPDDAQDAAYRLVHCQGGCGPAGLELSWELPKGRRTVQQVWIPPNDRSRLDGLLHAEPRTLTPEP